MVFQFNIWKWIWHNSPDSFSINAFEKPIYRYIRNRQTHTDTFRFWSHLCSIHNCLGCMSIVFNVYTFPWLRVSLSIKLDCQKCTIPNIQCLTWGYRWVLRKGRAGGRYFVLKCFQIVITHSFKIYFECNFIVQRSSSSNLNRVHRECVYKTVKHI